MGASVIDGSALAEELKERMLREAATLTGEGAEMGLATVLVGDDYASRAYERRVRGLAGELGCRYVCEQLPEESEEADAVAAVGKLNADPRISGVLVLRPLPDHISEAKVSEALNPVKDIEAVHPENAGLLTLGRPRYVPSTPAAAFYALDSYLASSGREPAEFYEKSDVVVIGRSNNVGRPLVSLAFARNATVISCDEHTSYAGRLREHTEKADALIVAAGVPGLIDRSYVREGAIAIDVGINPVEDPDTGKTRLVGDINFESIARKAEAVSPVPGGIGPITDVWLLHNTVLAATLGAGIEPEELGMGALSAAGKGRK